MNLGLESLGRVIYLPKLDLRYLKTPLRINPRMVVPGIKQTNNISINLSIRECPTCLQSSSQDLNPTGIVNIFDSEQKCFQSRAMFVTSISGSCLFLTRKG